MMISCVLSVLTVGSDQLRIRRAGRLAA